MGISQIGNQTEQLGFHSWNLGSPMSNPCLVSGKNGKNNRYVFGIGVSLSSYSYKNRC
jgi:hypothetical protein